MTRIFPALACLAALSGCVPAETGGGGPAGPTVYQTEAGAVTILPLSDTTQRPAIRRTLGDRCGAGSLQAFVNQPEAVFFRYTFPEGTRFIRPGDAVTQDYDDARLNFIIGANGRVQQVRCG